ncbi:MAG: di-trans,poly-cis-decaprenylcistransferase [Treponema sp.]|jgi:undecaprenyl diphosphate synthase|nr:di-trans,poly-cis-decaprenylcistransferase [Treponema sp.]
MPGAPGKERAEKVYGPPEKPVPAHVGIIMDGNGRWAQSRGLPRTQGHLEGLKAAKRIVKAASDLGILYLTLYVFSTENWKRAGEEVGFIMSLIKKYLRGELNFYRENRIRIRHAGDPAGLSPDIVADLRTAAEDTKNFGGMQVILALNYGGRDEIVRALRRFAKDAGSGICPGGSVTEEAIRARLDNPDVPDPDLVVRTAGEFRISNFLLWEGAYAEYVISPKLWPDFTEEDLVLAVNDYRNRDRRFGGIVSAERGFNAGKETRPAEKARADG